MPSEKPAKESSNKDKDKAGKDKRGSSGGRDGKSKDGKGEAKLSVAEIKAEEYREFVKASVISHSGWLSTPLLNLSSALSLSPLHFSLFLLSLLLLILLLAPPSWIPHISAPVTLLIPLQNSLNCISQLKRSKKGSGTGGEVQWMLFWIGWVLAGWAGEMIRTFRPGWKGVWEVGKVGVAVVLGGPWFSKEAMIPGKTSPKLAEAEKREAAEQARAEKQAKEADKKNAAREGKEEGKAKDEAKEKARAKARAKEMAEKARAEAS